MGLAMRQRAFLSKLLDVYRDRVCQLLTSARRPATTADAWRGG